METVSTGHETSVEPGPRHAASCRTSSSSWVPKNLSVLDKTALLSPFTAYFLASLIIKFRKILAYTLNAYTSNVIPPFFQQEYTVNYRLCSSGGPDHRSWKLAKNAWLLLFNTLEKSRKPGDLVCWCPQRSSGLRPRRPLAASFRSPPSPALPLRLSRAARTLRQELGDVRPGACGGRPVPAGERWPPPPCQPRAAAALPPPPPPPPPPPAPAARGALPPPAARPPPPARGFPEPPGAPAAPPAARARHAATGLAAAGCELAAPGGSAGERRPAGQVVAGRGLLQEEELSGPPDPQ